MSADLNPSTAKTPPQSFPAFPHLNLPAKTHGIHQRCLLPITMLGVFLHLWTHQIFATLGSVCVAAVLVNALLNDDPEIFDIASLYLRSHILNAPRSPWFMDSPRKPGPRHKVLRFRN